MGYIHHMKLLLTSLIVFAATGCAKYEYDIVAPPELRAHVGSKSDTVTKLTRS